MNKRYCSHCGTPNLSSAKTCVKCSKPISSGLVTTSVDNEEEVVIVKKKIPAKARRIKYVDEDGNELDDENTFNGITPTLSMKDIVIEKPKKLTIAELKNGAQVPSFSTESLPADIEVSSRSYFHQEKLD